MKQVLTLFIAGLAITALVACNNPAGSDQNETEAEIQPAPMSDEIAAFFGTSPWANVAKYYFDNGKLTPGTDGCVMINSADELYTVLIEENNLNPEEFPVIDFTSHTLVFGFHATQHSWTWIIDQHVVVGTEKTTLYINIGQTGNSGGFFMGAIVFWGLYPKLPELPIEVVRR